MKRRQRLKADDHAIWLYIFLSCSSHIQRVHCWSKPQPKQQQKQIISKGQVDY